MIFVKICLIWLFIQEQALLTDAIVKFYTTEGSTMNFPVGTNITQTYFVYHGKRKYIDYQRVKSNRYDIVLRPNILEFQIINVTASDEGFYWFGNYRSRTYLFELKIKNMTCSSSPIERVCAITGSSPMIKYSFDFFGYYDTNDKPYWKRFSSRFIKNQIHADLQMYNVTREDEGFYQLKLLTDLNRETVHQLVIVDIWFINQTEIHTIIGQEGKEMEINCSTDKAQYITALKIESNGSVLAIGDKQSVSYSFIPQRTDHLTSYTCVDITHSSIMIEVTLIIRYAPAVTLRYTNGTIECDCDGVPPVYSVYRLDRISKYGELVYSINLDNGTFIFNTDQFPYQINGRYMCVVSNGMPDTNGKELQNSSTHVNYEGPPVFAKENIYVNHGKVGLSSIRMSFLVYSCPDVEEIFLQKLGRMRDKKRKLHKYVLKSTLLYNELDNETEVPGYDILIESDELDIEDFQAYIITVTNRLGASDYHFEIIKKENPPLVKRERTDFMILGIIGIILFVNMIIIHICIRVKHIQNRDQRHQNVGEAHTYHTYDEIGSVSYRAERPMRSSDTNDNQRQNQTEQLGVGISIEMNRQSTIDNTVELNTDVSDVGLQQSDITDDQVQSIAIAVDNRNVVTTHLSHVQSTDLPSIEHILIRETPSDQHRQASNDSDSESSQTVMVGNAGDGYENPYQTVYQDHQESHQYNQATRERNNSISSADDNTTVIQSMQNIVNRNQTDESTSKESSSDEQSQISDDSDNGSFIYGMVGNIGEGYENPYQMILQDYAESHPYTRIKRARDNSNSSTESDKSEEQQIGTGSTKKEEYINLKL